MPATILNKQGPIDHCYLAHFKGEAVVVYARSLYAAKQLAVEHFKPKKKDAGLLSVNLHKLGAGRTVVLEEAVA